MGGMYPRRYSVRTKTYLINSQMEQVPFHIRPALPSRVSRRGLPCPEVWDTHVPLDEKDMRGFIPVRRPERRRRRWLGKPADPMEDEECHN